MENEEKLRKIMIKKIYIYADLTKQKEENKWRQLTEKVEGKNVLIGNSI